MKFAFSWLLVTIVRDSTGYPSVSDKPAGMEVLQLAQDEAGVLYAVAVRPEGDKLIYHLFAGRGENLPGMKVTNGHSSQGSTLLALKEKES